MCAKEVTVTTPIRVLIVEDSSDDAELVCRELKDGGYDVTSTRVETAEGMTQALENDTWDIVISDYVMPRFDGRTALDTLKTSGLDIPFIMVSGKVGEDVAVEAMKAGASDYLIKDNLLRLCPAVKREIKEAAERRGGREAREALTSELELTNARLEELVITDPLTEALNRRGIQRALGQELDRMTRSGESLVAILIDCDDFKTINDGLGFAVGDALLTALTKSLRSGLRSGDHLGRVGGDEFLVLLPDTSVAEGTVVAEKLRQRIKTTILPLSKLSQP